MTLVGDVWSHRLRRASRCGFSHEIKDVNLIQMKTIVLSARGAKILRPSAVLTKALLRAAEMLEFRGATLARILGISEASIHRLMTGEREIDPDSKEGEFAALLIRLFRGLDALVGGDAELRIRWLQSPNRALNGVPKVLLLSTEGLVHTVAYLDSARAPL